MKINVLLRLLFPFLLAVLAGCGQKGDLYLPDSAQQQKPQPPADILEKNRALPPEKAASH